MPYSVLSSVLSKIVRYITIDVLGLDHVLYIRTTDLDLKVGLTNSVYVYGSVV